MSDDLFAKREQESLDIAKKTSEEIKEMMKPALEEYKESNKVTNNITEINLEDEKQNEGSSLSNEKVRVRKIENSGPKPAVIEYHESTNSDANSYSNLPSEEIVNTSSIAGSTGTLTLLIVIAVIVFVALLVIVGLYIANSLGF